MSRFHVFLCLLSLISSAGLNAASTTTSDPNAVQRFASPTSSTTTYQATSTSTGINYNYAASTADPNAVRAATGTYYQATQPDYQLNVRTLNGTGIVTSAPKVLPDKNVYRLNSAERNGGSANRNYRDDQLWGNEFNNDNQNNRANRFKRLPAASGQE